MGPLLLLTSALGLYSVISSLFGILNVNTPNLFNVIINSLTEEYSCDPDYKYVTITELIQSKGYSVEIHHVINDQGYILELHRISSDGFGNKPYRNRPIIMHHGLLSSSADFVLNYPNNSLGYYCADHGYDVWLCNIRGNYYSQRNTNISNLNPEFWKFTLDDVALHDIPKIVDHVVKTTNKSQAYYVGFSMGTTVGLGALAANATLREQIKGMFLLGPATTLTDVRGLLGLLPPPIPYWLLRNTVVLPKTFLNEIWAPGFCYGPVKLIFDLLFDTLTGDTFGTLIRSRYATLSMQLPCGSSIMYINQFLQIRAARKFQMYDFGPEENYNRYGQRTPPEYNITKITCPVRLYNAPHDYLSGPKESPQICGRLPDCILTTYGTSQDGHLGLVYNPNSKMLQDILNHIGYLDAM